MTDDFDKYYYPVIKEDSTPAQVPLYLPVPEPPLRDPKEDETVNDEKKRGVIIIDI